MGSNWTHNLFKFLFALFIGHLCGNNDFRSENLDIKVVIDQLANDHSVALINPRMSRLIRIRRRRIAMQYDRIDILRFLSQMKQQLTRKDYYRSVILNHDARTLTCGSWKSLKIFMFTSVTLPF